MQIFPSPTEIIRLGPLSITYYAFFIVIGAIIAYHLSKINTNKMKYPKEILNDLFVDSLLVGIVGARIWYCLFDDFNYYFSNPINILKIYEGGLAIHGGIIFGLVYSYFYAQRKKVSWLKLADATMVNALIAQAIGRWGNFVNKEAHGLIVDASFFDGFLSFLKDGMYIHGHYYFPTFFFESMLNLLGFCLIVLIVKRFVKKRGQLFFSYLIWYGFVRFFIEFYRIDALKIGNLMIAQIISIIYVVVGLLGFIGFFNRFKKTVKPSILFNLDNTLIDSQQGTILSFKKLFENYHSTVNFDEIDQSEFLELPVHLLINKYFPNEDKNALVLEYDKYNSQIFEDVNQLMPNAYYILKLLKDQNFNIGIVASKNHQTIIEQLKIYNLDPFVDAIIGSDDVINDKPNPEGINKILTQNKWLRDEVIYVGNSFNDILIAENANVYSVSLVSHNQIKNLDQTNTKIKDLKDLINVINQDIHFTYDGR